MQVTYFAKHTGCYFTFFFFLSDTPHKALYFWSIFSLMSERTERCWVQILTFSNSFLILWGEILIIIASLPISQCTHTLLIYSSTLLSPMYLHSSELKKKNNSQLEYINLTSLSSVYWHQFHQQESSPQMEKMSFSPFPIIFQKRTNKPFCNCKGIITKALRSLMLLTKPFLSFCEKLTV